MDTIKQEILDPITTFLFAAAVVYFLYGLFEFIKNQDNKEAQSSGKHHMFWGVVGVFLMVAVSGVLKLIANTVGNTDIAGML